MISRTRQARLMAKVAEDADGGGRKVDFFRALSKAMAKRAGPKATPVGLPSDATSKSSRVTDTPAFKSEYARFRKNEDAFVGNPKWPAPGQPLSRRFTPAPSPPPETGRNASVPARNFAMSDAVPEVTGRPTDRTTGTDSYGNLVEKGTAGSKAKPPVRQDGTLTSSAPTTSTGATAVAPMKEGKGYDWLAKQWGGGVTGSQVRQHMKGKMLHPGVNYARPDNDTLASIRGSAGMKSKFNFGAKKTAPTAAPQQVTSAVTPERLSALRESSVAAAPRPPGPGMSSLSNRFGQIPTRMLNSTGRLRNAENLARQATPTPVALREPTRSGSGRQHSVPAL